MRWTEHEFLRPELLLTVADVAERLGVSIATVHHKITKGKLGAHLFGNQHRVRPDDLGAYVAATEVERPPPGEDWRTVRELMQVANVSRSVVHRLIRRRTLPSRTFGGLRYVRGDDFDAFVRIRRDCDGTS